MNFHERCFGAMVTDALPLWSSAATLWSPSVACPSCGRRLTDTIRLFWAPGRSEVYLCEDCKTASFVTRHFHDP